jgi:hypothetical protein
MVAAGFSLADQAGALDLAEQIARDCFEGDALKEGHHVRPQ